MTTCSVLFAGCREAARVRRVHRLEPELREGVVRGSIRRRSSVRRRVLRGGHGRAQAVAAHQARPVRAEHTHDYPPSHSNTQSPPNHHPITTELPPNYHPITTEVPPNHHRITTESLTIETHPLRDRCDAKGPSEKFILPAATGQGVSDMVNTIPFFKKCHCAGPSHLVALTGAHTLGHVHSRYVPCFVPSKVPSKVPLYYSYPPKVSLYSFIYSNLIPI